MRDLFPLPSSLPQVMVDGEAAPVAKVAVDHEDLEQIRAAQRGDEYAFEALVQSYDRGVLRLAMNLLRSQEDAAEVYQEAFLRVYQNLHTFRFDCSFQSWLYRIVTNLCLDLLRKRRVRKEEAPVIKTEDGERDMLSSFPEFRGQNDPLRHLLSSQLEARINAVLDGLTPRERMVFELRHYDGMRLKAIGDVLGTTEEAAKNCLFRATRKLRASLGDFV